MGTPNITVQSMEVQRPNTCCAKRLGIIQEAKKAKVIGKCHLQNFCTKHFQQNRHYVDSSTESLYDT